MTVFTNITEITISTTPLRPNSRNYVHSQRTFARPSLVLILKTSQVIHPSRASVLCAAEFHSGAKSLRKRRRRKKHRTTGVYSLFAIRVASSMGSSSFRIVSLDAFLILWISRRSDVHRRVGRRPQLPTQRPSHPASWVRLVVYLLFLFHQLTITLDPQC